MIDNFVERYSREVEHFQETARRCAAQCEEALKENGIRAITTYRAKQLDRLKEKLQQRAAERGKPYTNHEQIYSDIVDLAGVRVALYFPGDRTEAKRIIRNLYEIVKEKSFPTNSDHSKRTEKVFSGYAADHFRVRLKEESLAQEDKKFARNQIEIQVASVLMHAWAEVEHDLAYKPLTGQLSSNEYALLDQVNGLVLSGEVALMLLQKAIQSRVAESGKPFGNHYELAAFLFDTAKPSTGKPIFMGRADVLLDFLNRAGLSGPDVVRPLIRDIDPSRSIAEQVVDYILSQRPELHVVYQKSRMHFLS